MSFGMYRPTMGVASGHRELSSNRSLQENRRLGEQFARQEINPITGQAAPGRSSTPRSRPPSGNLSAGLLPNKGPLDHMTVPDRDVPSKRVDPTRNQSLSLGTGIACVPVHTERALPPRPAERPMADILQMRDPTPERRSSSGRSTPGQVVRANSRPKDNMSGGCLVADRPAVDPMGFPRKAGSGAPGVGSGGSGHLVQGPCGFVPAGGFEDEEPTMLVGNARAPSPFRSVWA